MITTIKNNNLGYNGSCENCGEFQTGMKKQPYIVNFPSGAQPQPFELAEILLSEKPELNLDRLGRL